MAKPNRGGRRGGGPSYSSGELTLPDGTSVEYEGKLQYGGDDSHLSGTARIAVEGWEDKRGKSKIEWAYSVGPDGTPLMQEKRGGKGSVRVPISAHDTEGATFTHIHPRGDGMLGGTFSSADMSNFAYFKNTTVRAKAKEGTYSISKESNFDRGGFMRYVRQIDSKFSTSYEESEKKVRKQYYDKKISYDEYKVGAAKAFNTALVGLHNDYIAGQKQYGYSYTLEQNKGGKK